MDTERNRREDSADDQNGEQDKRESGQPGGGQGRRDEVGPTGVYPLGADNIPPNAEIRMAGSWGGGDYNEAGGSELIYHDGVLLGGLTAGPDGEPTIDIHDGNPPPDTRGESESSDGNESGGPDVVDRNELLLRGLLAGAEGEPTVDSRGGGDRAPDTRRKPKQDKRAQS
jgi:hypothetical protein